VNEEKGITNRWTLFCRIIYIRSWPFRQNEEYELNVKHSYVLYMHWPKPGVTTGIELRVHETQHKNLI
jgi:hypothetical protein